MKNRRTGLIHSLAKEEEEMLKKEEMEQGTEETPISLESMMLSQQFSSILEELNVISEELVETENARTLAENISECISSRPPEEITDAEVKMTRLALDCSQLKGSKQNEEVVAALESDIGLSKQYKLQLALENTTYLISLAVKAVVIIYRKLKEWIKRFMVYIQSVFGSNLRMLENTIAALDKSRERFTGKPIIRTGRTIRYFSEHGFSASNGAPDYRKIMISIESTEKVSKAFMGPIMSGLDNLSEHMFSPFTNFSIKWANDITGALGSVCTYRRENSFMESDRLVGGVCVRYRPVHVSNAKTHQDLVNYLATTRPGIFADWENSPNQEDSVTGMAFSEYRAILVALRNLTTGFISGKRGFALIEKCCDKNIKQASKGIAASSEYMEPARRFATELNAYGLVCVAAIMKETDVFSRQFCLMVRAAANAASKKNKTSFEFKFESH